MYIRLLIFVAGTVIGYLAGGYLEGLLEEESKPDTNATEGAVK